MSFAIFKLRMWSLTHWRCFNCRRWKGVSLHRICWQCQYDRFRAARVRITALIADVDETELQMIETLEDVLESIADEVGVYGSHDDSCGNGYTCRVCWISGLRKRVERAVDVERKLR
jgi:hypothetical protein